MEVKYSRPFEKDLRSLSNRSVILKTDQIISTLATVSSVKELKGVKSLKGHRNCYRIRIGEYRLGILVDGNKVWLARLMHRKEIYRHFP